MEKIENSCRIALIDYEFYRLKGGIATYYKNLFYILSDAGFSIVLFCSVTHPIEEFKYKNSKIVGVVSSDIEDFRLSLISPFFTEHNLQKFSLIETSEINCYATNLIKKIKGIKLHVRAHAPNYLIDRLNKTYIPFWRKARYVLGAFKIGKFDLGYWKKYEKNLDQEYNYSNKGNIISAPTRAMMAWIDSNWNLNSKKKIIFPNPFIPANILNVKPLKTNVQYKTILFFGRLNVLKGLRNATIAISNILSNNPDWRFIVVGDDGQSPSFSNLSMKEWMKLKLSKVINQVDFYDSMPNEELKLFIEKSEIVVLTSLFESFSYACLEAMSAGRVVIGSSCGGMGDLIKHGYNGFIINPYKIQEISKCLNNLIKNHTLICQIGENAYDHIRREFDYNNQIVYFKSIYQEILN